jgi:hypothetical protein
MGTDLPIRGVLGVNCVAGGLTQFDSFEIFLTLPKFQWEEILQIDASMD